MGFFDLFRKKSVNATPVPTWQPLIHEPYTGAWQKNDELKRTDLTSFHAVFACVSLIASDIGKLKIHTKSMQDGVLLPTHSRSQSILKKPNRHQTWQQFAENWITSKLLRGNAYIFKQRDIFGDVWQLYVLNPDRVKVLVSDKGDVLYQVARDKLFDMQTDMIVPSSEMIHDRFNCFYHPLVGLSPISACAVSVGVGLAIQQGQAILFKNDSRPSGVLTTPSPISQARADELKIQWRQKYSGQNRGDVAVLGDGARYETISLSSADTQAVEQLKMRAKL